MKKIVKSMIVVTAIVVGVIVLGCRNSDQSN